MEHAMTCEGDVIGRVALQALIGFAFANCALTEIMADIDPRNDASLSLLARLGFRKTGFAQRTIEVAGVWCDSIYMRLGYDEWPR